MKLWQTSCMPISPALAMRKLDCLPMVETYCSVCVSQNPASLGRRAFNSWERGNLLIKSCEHYCVALNTPSHTYMEPSLFSNQCICQRCFFAANYIKVQSTGARVMHSCISLLLRFPVPGSRAWICLIQAIVCVHGRRGSICYYYVPSRQLAKQSASSIKIFFLLLNSPFPPITPINKNKLFSH